ncbi:STAS domain-containing protein [Streptomyces sp. NBC_01276]|uniref:STAS domain-containing protein n=1 Tax=Streptomyces sp. NBC_01276 TaxID=2903808 RepID=UPI00352C3E7E
MDIDVEVHGSATVVRPHGEMDISRAGHFRHVLLDALSGERLPYDVVVGLQHLSFCDSSGLNALLAARTVAPSRGRAGRQTRWVALDDRVGAGLLPAGPCPGAAVRAPLPGVCRTAPAPAGEGAGGGGARVPCGSGRQPVVQASLLHAAGGRAACSGACSGSAPCMAAASFVSRLTRPSSFKRLPLQTF